MIPSIINLSYTFITTPAIWGINIMESLLEAVESIVFLFASIVLLITNLSIYLLQISSRVQLGEAISNGWENSIYYVNIAAVFFLLAIALANALRLNIETYEIKKSLPSLVAGLILANFSLLLCKGVLDFTDVIIYELISSSNSNVTLGEGLVAFILGQDPHMFTEGLDLKVLLESIGGQLGLGIIAATATGGGGLVLILAGLLFTLIPAMLIFALSIVSFARIIIIYILVVLAPLGVMALFFPPTKGMGQKWIDGFLQWAFAAPAIFFVLRLTTYFGSGSKDVFVANDTGGVDFEYFKYWAQYLSGLALLVFALILPFTISGLGSQIMSFAKKALTDYIPEKLQLKEHATKFAYGNPISKKLGLAGMLARRDLDRHAKKDDAKKTIESGRASDALRRVNDLDAKRRAAKNDGDNDLAKKFEGQMKGWGVHVFKFAKDGHEAHDNKHANQIVSELAELERPNGAYDLYKKGKLTDVDDFKKVSGLLQALKRKQGSFNDEERKVANRFYAPDGSGNIINSNGFFAGAHVADGYSSISTNDPRVPRAGYPMPDISEADVNKFNSEGVSGANSIINRHNKGINKPATIAIDFKDLKNIDGSNLKGMAGVHIDDAHLDHFIDQIEKKLPKDQRSDFRKAAKSSGSLSLINKGRAGVSAKHVLRHEKLHGDKNFNAQMESEWKAIQNRGDDKSHISLDWYKKNYANVGNQTSNPQDMYKEWRIEQKIKVDDAKRVVNTNTTQPNPTSSTPTTPSSNTTKSYGNRKPTEKPLIQSQAPNTTVNQTIVQQAPSSSPQSSATVVPSNSNAATKEDIASIKSEISNVKSVAEGAHSLAANAGAKAEANEHTTQAALDSTKVLGRRSADQEERVDNVEKHISQVDRIKEDKKI